MKIQPIVIAFMLLGITVSGQGPLTPPGAPAPTMKTLDQIEPRTPIASLPYTITQPGGYYLTGNLVGTSTGIVILASSVTLDLMGFELAGGLSATSSGILVSGVHSNITVRNGTVRNWPFQGVSANNARYSRFEHLRLTDNRQRGIITGESCEIRSCTAVSNTLAGIQGGERNRVIDCTGFYNNTGMMVGSDGLILRGMAAHNQFGMGGGQGSRIDQCMAVSNTVDGVQVFGTAITVERTTAHGNGQHGIHFWITTAGGVVRDCVASENGKIGILGPERGRISGSRAMNNLEDGILAGRYSIVENNISSGNGREGIWVQGTGGVRIEGNEVYENIRGFAVIASACLIIHNRSINNTLSDYFLLAGNEVGPIGDLFTVQYEPWANFSP